MILYDRFEFEDTLQNKGNRLVLGVFDHESQKYLAVKFHLQLWEKFGKRTEESIIEEIEILKKLQGLNGIPELINYNLQPKFDENIGLTFWIGLQWYKTYENYNDIISFSFIDLKLWIELCRTFLKIVDQGIVHRDLKPNNLLILKSNKGYSFKIVDFGEGRIYNIKEKAWTEFLREDLFNLGKLLFYILSGKRILRLAQEDLEHFESKFSSFLTKEIINICRLFISAPNSTKKEDIEKVLDNLGSLIENESQN